jgi:hypothetical protein
VWNVAAGSTLRLTGLPARSTTRRTDQAGAGSVETRQVLAQGLTVNAGTVRIIPNGYCRRDEHRPRAKRAERTIRHHEQRRRRSITTPPTRPARVDLKSQIASAYAGGAWSGNGITTSNGDATHFAVGYGERSALLDRARDLRHRRCRCRAHPRNALRRRDASTAP